MQGPYVVTITVTSSESDDLPQQLLCLEVDFEIASPSAGEAVQDVSEAIRSKLHSGRRALASS